MSEDLPYKAEYAKSGRVSCKACKGNISKDSLRVAKMVQSHHFDGKVPNWFHFSCFFKKSKAVSPGEIGVLSALRWEDQEKIKGKLVGGEPSGAGSSSAAESSDLKVEHAKSSRSKCKGCQEQINKSRDKLGVGSSVTVQSFAGFKQLKKEDQKILQQKLGSSGEAKAHKGKKRKGQAEEAVAPKKINKTAEEEKEEELLKEQSKFLWKIRDELRKSCSLAELREMLEDNEQPTHGGESDVLDRCVEGMALGRLMREAHLQNLFSRARFFKARLG